MIERSREPERVPCKVWVVMVYDQLVLSPAYAIGDIDGSLAETRFHEDDGQGRLCLGGPGNKIRG